MTPDTAAVGNVAAIEDGSDIRASDAERERAVAALHRAVGEGRLDLHEAETRMSDAYAARFRRELLPLLVDLPDAHSGSWTAAGEPPSWSALWTGLVWRLRNSAWDRPGARSEVPTTMQRRIAAAVAVVALLWFAAFVALGVVAT